MTERVAAWGWGLAVLALLVSGVAGPAVAQAGADYTVGGIDYYYASGTYESGRFAVDGGSGALLEQPFDGCAYAKLRPDANKGRIQALGLWDHVPVNIDANEFPDANRTPDSIGRHEVPAELTGLAEPWEATMMATTPNATVRLGGLPIADPVSGEAHFQATWFVTPRGYRDDADGSLRPEGRDEWEMHLRIGSRPDASPQGPATWSASEPSEGTPTIVPDAEYSKVFAVPNLRLFGQATLTASATSLLPPGSNDLAVTVYAPDGSVLGETRLAPALGATTTERLEFSLDRPGVHFVQVHGPVSLASYSLDIEQTPPDSFVLDLWWDDVQPGYAGLQAREECADLLQGAQMSSYVPPRPPPTQFDWTFTLFTLGAALTLLAITASLGIAAYNHLVARRAVQG